MQRSIWLQNNDFDVESKVCSGAPRKFEDEELEALLHEDSYQTLAELAESLGIDHTIILKRNKFESIRNDSKARTLDAVVVEAERRRTTFHVFSFYV